MSDDTSQILIRMSLLGSGQVKSEIVSTGAAVQGFGDEAEVTGDKSAFAAEKTFLFGEAMYSLRRYAFYALTAIGVTGAGILKMGYDFDEAKAKATGALTSLVGGTRNAETEVSKLVTLTHQSGLGLSTLATATQQMLTFGFSVRDTNVYMEAFANYAGKLGLGAGGLTSLAELFNQVQSQGFLGMRQLKALQALGIPASGALEQALGLTPAQMFSLEHGQYQVTSSTALPALAAWIRQYANEQPGTLSQDWGILHSYLSQITGAIGTPVFNWLTSFVQGLNKPGGLLSRAGAGYDAGGMKGMLKAIDPSGQLLEAWQTLTSLIRTFGTDLGIVWKVAQPFVGILLITASAVLELTSRFKILDPVLTGLLFLYVSSRTALLLYLGATKLITVGFALLRLAVVGLRAAWMLLDAAIFSNPVGAVVIGFVALAIVFYELYTRVGWFRNGVNTLWHDLVYAAPGIAAALTLAFGPIGTALTGILLIIRYWSQIKSFFEGPQLNTSKLLTSKSYDRQVEGFVGKTNFDKIMAAARAQSAASRRKDTETRAVKTEGAVMKLDPTSAQQLADATAQALRDNPPILKVDGQLLGDATSKARLTAEARR